MLIIKAKTGYKFVRICENHTQNTFLAFLCQTVNAGCGIMEEQMLDMRSYSTFKGAKAYAAKKLK